MRHPGVPMAPEGRGIRACLAAALSVLLYACATYPVNEPLARNASMAAASNIAAEADMQHSDSLRVVLTFSGGGMCAAAFSYGALEGLRDIEILWKDERRRLVDGIDPISGGSFTAAYHGLHCVRTCSDFESQFLDRNIQGGVVRQRLDPYTPRGRQ